MCSGTYFNTLILSLNISFFLAKLKLASNGVAIIVWSEKGVIKMKATPFIFIFPSSLWMAMDLVCFY